MYNPPRVENMKSEKSILAKVDFSFMKEEWGGDL
jgi:hypothetical protein